VHPFEWPFPVIPFVTADPLSHNEDKLENINYISSIIMGIHESDFGEIMFTINPDNIEKTIILDLRYVYEGGD
jgi:hypothetical protein